VVLRGRHGRHACGPRDQWRAQQRCLDELTDGCAVGEEESRSELKVGLLFASVCLLTNETVNVVLNTTSCRLTFA
jgi:hypothetical protein